MLGLITCLEALSFGASGCAGAHTPETEPVPSLARSEDAQREFRDLSKTRSAAHGHCSPELDLGLRRFVERYPDDGRTPLVRVYSALCLIDEQRLTEARRVLAPLESEPIGSARDLSELAKAAIWLAESKPQKARGHLEPLRGKLIGAEERLLYGELLVRTAIAEKRVPEAVLDMRYWLHSVEPSDVPEVKQKVLGFITRFERSELEQANAWLARGRGQTEQQQAVLDWLAKEVARELATSALEAGDTDLARRLVESMPKETSDLETRAELERLAEAGQLQRKVVGRTMGLVLSLKTSETRHRSSQASSGVTQALGLPVSARDPERVKLLVKDDATGMPNALASLATAGASILIAGMDAEGADQASAFAEDAAIPVLVLSESSARSRAPSFAFSLAAPIDEQRKTLVDSLKARGKSRWLEIGSTPAADVACPDGPAAPSEQTSKQQGFDSMLVLGSARCGDDLVTSLMASGHKPLVAFGLEAAPLASEPPFAGSALYLHSGSYLGEPPAMAREGWYEALGHDAARLAEQVLLGFSRETVDDARIVRQLHTRGRDKLLNVSASLVSTERRGFEGTHQLARALSSESGSKKKQP